MKATHRAFTYKSHSGSYGEVNSEEGYQNLQRFLFERWAVALSFSGLPQPTPADGTTWQADLHLAIRGLPVVVSEQQAEHWCPIILTRELAAEADSADSPVPIVSTLLLETEPPGPDRPTGDDVGLSRYVVTLRVYKVVQTHGGSDFRNHLEQVSDWADSPIVDVGPAPGGTLGAWSGWNADILASNDAVPRMPNELALAPDAASSTLVGTVQLPAAARALPIFGPDASLQFTVSDRATATARQ